MSYVTTSTENSKCFKLTERKVRLAISNACTVLKSVCNTFVAPIICDIKLTKAKSYWANIRRINMGCFSLRVSNIIEMIPETDLAQRRLEETIIHELIHTMPDRFNHGPKFKLMCDLVNRKYKGMYVIRTKNSCESYGFKIDDKPKVRYEIKCPHCGKTYFYSRKPKYELSSYTCTRCGLGDLYMTCV